MIIEYDVNCFDRCLVIKCNNVYEAFKEDMLKILDKAYLNWHSPEDIEDPEEREWVENDACCEEYMMSKLTEKYPECDADSWNTFYYGNDYDELEEEAERQEHNHNYNARWLDKVLDKVEDLNYQFEPFEKLGNEAYHIVGDCIQKLKELKKNI